MCCGSTIVRWHLLSLAILLGIGMLMSTATPRPSTVLWVWGRPEDLSSVSEMSFAVLAGSFELDGQQMQYRARRHPVVLPPDAETTAVFRIDAKPGAAFPSAAMARQIVAAVPPSAKGVQVDFDARASERDGYRILLRDLRRKLPRKTTLSITALASWCLDDPWIRDLPLDHAVPMLFQMGADAEYVRSYFERGGSFRVALCRGNAGLSLDEPFYRLPDGTRQLYLFSPEPWNDHSLAAAQNAGVLR